jgi:tRNA pseudouridine38/39 synthase
MTTQQRQQQRQQQQSTNKCHPLLRELDICGIVKANVNVDLNANKTEGEDAISPSDVLSFLLENGILPEDSIRNAVQTMRRKRQAMKGSRTNNTDANEIAQVAVSKNDADVSMDSDNKKDKLSTTSVPRDSVAAPAAPITQNSNDVTRTRHIALRFFYDGASYSGLAQNMGQENDNSVERWLFDALQKARLVVSRETCNFSRCGRTDRGVSSAGQVVALNIKSAFPRNVSWDEDGTSLLEAKDLPKNEYESRKVWTVPRSKKKNNNSNSDRVEKEINEYSYSKILNNILPPSIRILGWTPVTEEFSARFSARARTYRYFFCKRRMNTDAIRDGLSRLVGKHDFRNLCKMDVEKIYNFERLIHSAELVDVQDPTITTKHGEVCYLKIIGQAFLWHQIRCIAEIIFMVGNEFESPTIITELLDIEKNPGKPGYNYADEKPLVLHDCAFPKLQFGYSVQNLWTVACQLEKQWEDLTLAAARIRSGIESLRSCSIFTEDMVQFSNSKLAERRKKLERRGIFEVVDTDSRTAIDESLMSSKVISWGDGLSWLDIQHNLVPCQTGLTNAVHVPLMKRAKGPSYEEKVANVKKSEKRRRKFEENVIKKRKTAEEDQAFYDLKIKQGGTGI